MKSRIFAHSDLDGVVSAIVMHKYLIKTYGEHDIKITYESYESINLAFADLLDTQDEYQEILIGDISINAELAAKCHSNVGIYDHHDTAKHLLECNNPRFIYEEKMCGAAVCHKHLLGKDMTLPFRKLLGMTNTYDLWNIKLEDKMPLNLNIIVNNLKMVAAFKRFYDGFDGFSKSEEDVIAGFWKIQDRMFEIVEKTHVGPPHKMNLLIVKENPEEGFFDMNYWAHFLMEERGYKCVLIDRPSKKRWSIRLRKSLSKQFHLGYWIRDNITNDHKSAGGHAAAAGCSYAGTSADEIADTLIKLYKELDVL